MTLRTGVSIALIIFAIGLCFWLFVRPVIMPPEKAVRFVEEQKLYYIGNSEEGKRTYAYADIKDEAKEWIKILAPVITLLTAYFLKGRKKQDSS